MYSTMEPILSTAGPLWRADRLDARRALAGHATGYDTLDAELPDLGWPRSGLIEILTHGHAAEWSLLAPWLRQPAADAGPILCLAPPHEPYAPALHHLGLPLERLLIVRAETSADAAWAGEQALQLMACKAILWWVSANIKAATPVMLRRLHLASMVHQTPVFVFGPAQSCRRSSPAPLRLMLGEARSKLAVSVIKRRGPAMTQSIELDRAILDGRTLRRWQALTSYPSTASQSCPDPSRTARCADIPSATVDHALALPAPAGLAA